MARPSKPWFRASKNTWYITVDGKKVSLKVQGEENEKEALQAWHRLMANGTVEPTQEPKAKMTGYCLRHTFATDALANGVLDAQVAELMGHSGTATLHRHYSHLTERAQALKDVLGKVR